jgi:hypothetical protein
MLARVLTACITRRRSRPRISRLPWPHTHAADTRLFAIDYDDFRHIGKRFVFRRKLRAVTEFKASDLRALDCFRPKAISDIQLLEESRGRVSIAAVRAEEIGTWS